MNILYINHYAGSPEMGMEFRPYYFSKKWHEAGENVDIIAASYSHLRRKNPNVNKSFQNETIDGVKYHWIKTVDYNSNGLRRTLSIFQFVFKLWIKSGYIIKKFNPDVVICSSTYPLDTFVAQRLKKKSPKKLVYIHEFHDMWPATLIEIGGMSKNHPFVKLIAYGEKKACRNADYIVSLLEYTEDYFLSLGAKQGRFKCIPIGIDPDKWEKKGLNNSHQIALKNLKSDGKFIVGYFGGHALSNALEVLIAVADRFKDKNKDIHFVLVGNGTEKKKLMENANAGGLDNITFLPPVEKNEIPELLSYFDCVYMGTKKSSLYRFGMCLNKMVDAMMSGKPLVCAITSPPTWAEKSGCAIITDSENVDGISQAIEEIRLMDPENKVQMGQNGIKFVKEELNLDILSKRFLDIMKSLLNSTR
ncbi:MAG: glycosyltransferase family 4 protein [Clostridiales bacterium]|nr:glycosyltransferase family 4 protein [Clostridiales bacterium]MDY6117227.1 glycosyltransferase family 4 protein [Anaerovoracaceae bacterium]